MLGTITLTVGQPDGVSLAQKEEAPESTETTPVEGTPHVNGEKMDKESPSANDISAVEEKVAEEKTDDAGEVGFKKIFTIVGLKFTLKKDKSDETDPVTLLTVKDKEEKEANLAEEPAKDKEASPVEEKTPTDENKAQTEASTPDGDATKDTEKDDAQPDGAAAEAASEETKEETAEKEAETAPPPKETGMSPFRKLFFVGLFSNLRKKSSIKKTKEEEEKEAAEKEETAKTEETTAEEKEVKDEAEQVTKDETTVSEEETKDGNVVTEQETKEETQETPVEGKAEPETKEEGTITQEEAKSDTIPEATTPTEATTDQSKEDQRAESSVEEKVPAEVSAEAELQSSQEKSKPHGSPLKKLFTGAGLKKLSTKRQKRKKESESKLTESGEQAADHPQSSAESEDAGKADSGPSSPEASGEHVVAADANQLESSQEVEGEVSSDGEKKKDSVIASFRKLVTPKKYAKRSSDSEDEGTNDKPAKSATLSSSESATLAEKSVEEEEKKEDKASEEEPKTENTEKLTCSTEETKKKMDTSVSWEALMCIGGPKKRTRKTSDSDDETKAEEEITGAAAGEEDSKEEGKNEEATAASQNPENEEVTPAPAPEPVPTPPVRESPWSTLKRLVMSKNKPKSEEKPDGPADQAQQDAETQKEESSFSLRKLFPGRKKKVPEKQASTDQGEEDSETPAVVPLSEYDEQVEAAQETPKEADTVQSKVSAEDRSPSWIPASVEDTADHHDQLSDIPEEAENAATPKSVDTDIAEDETDDQVVPPKGSGRMGRRLSTAEVKPITPAPAAATSPVPQGPRQHSAEEVIGAIEAQITALPTQTSVTLEDVPLEKASATSESEPETENAKPITVAILEPHPQGEAIALCTGLETKEIAAVDVEQPVEPTLECTGLLGAATNVETVVEEKSLEPQEAVASEDPVLQAHVNKVQTLALEPAADKLSSEIAEIEVASESYEPQIEKVGAVSTENMEVIQPTTQTENSPKTVVVNAIEPLPEAAVCIQSVEVSEVTVESKEGATDVEEGTPTNIEGAETAVPAVVPRDESAVITETVVLVAPNAISGNAKSVATEQTKEEANEVAHKASEIETQSAVIAEAVIKDAVDKVLEDGPEPKKPTATIPTPVQATATTESEVGIAADQVVITDTPIPDVCERPIHKAPQPLCVAMEVIEPVPIEVTENIKEDDNEEEKPKSNLKKAVEVQVSEDAVVEEEVTEIKGENGEEKKSKNEQEGAVKETSENGNKMEAPSEEKKEKEVEIHMPTHVVLQSAEEVEEQPVAVETVAMLDGNSSNTSVTAENPSRQNKLPELTEEPQETPCAQAAAASQCTDAGESQLEQKPSAKCVEVMAQVIEVIEEAVKEIEPVSKEITTAS